MNKKLYGISNGVAYDIETHESEFTFEYLVESTRDGITIRIPRSTPIELPLDKLYELLKPMQVSSRILQNYAVLRGKTVVNNPSFCVMSIDGGIQIQSNHSSIKIESFDIVDFRYLLEELLEGVI